MQLLSFAEVFPVLAGDCGGGDIALEQRQLAFVRTSAARASAARAVRSVFLCLRRAVHCGQWRSRPSFRRERVSVFRVGLPSAAAPSSFGLCITFHCTGRPSASGELAR